MTQTQNDEWETVAEPRTKMIFDTVGDVWTGIYEGTEIIIDPNTGESYDYLNFRDLDGEPYTTSASYTLKSGLSKVPVGSTVKITYMSDTDMGKGKNPMKNFKIQTRK